MDQPSDLSDMSSSKKQKTSECEPDRSSSLPDSILHHILSFLSTKDLMVTLLLSRYAHLWKTVQNLSFNQCEYHDCSDPEFDVDEYDKKLLSLIHNVLVHNESPQIQEFRLRFRFRFQNALDYEEGSEEINQEKRMASEISSWVQFAVKKSVKILCLDLKGCGWFEPGASYILPTIALSSKSLTELKLVGCDIKPRGKIQLKSLKTLSLGYTTLSDKTMEDILVGCPLLEELSLMDFSGLSTLILTNPKLKKLKLIIGFFLENKLKISCPYLVSLDIAGWIEQADLVKARSVVDASLHFSYYFRHECRAYDPIKTLLKNLSNSKVLTLCQWCIMVFTIAKFMNIKWPTFGWKSLVVERTPLTKWHLPGVLSLLKNSLYLESLTIYIRTGEATEKAMLLNKESKWMKSHDFDGEKLLNSEKGNFPCLQNHLRTVTLVGSVTEAYAVKLIEFLLKKAMVLNKMVIVAKKDGYAENGHPTPVDLLHFSQKLLTMQRASSNSTIHFLSPGV